jgi:hypothetical protein
MYGLIRAIDAPGSAAELGIAPSAERDGTPRIVNDRQRSGWHAAQLWLVGRNGGISADAWLTSGDLRTLSTRAARLADWIDNRRSRVCICTDGRHFDLAEHMCATMVFDRSPYCRACWSAEYGLQEHDRTDADRAAVAVEV